MSDNDSDSDVECPLCVEPLDDSDKNFLPCPCGYRVCMWCWHNIRENLNGLCPACRSPYNADPHAFSIVDHDDVIRKQKDRRLREKNDRKSGTSVVAIDRSGVAKPTSAVSDRRHLHNYRVVQRNLVYVIGVPVAASTEEGLRRAEYFGQYGKIGKIVVHGNRSMTHSTVSVYITFAYKEDAKAAIQVLDGYWLDGHHLRASFGTTKYCNNFIRGVPCNNPDCVYLHDIGEDEDRFTKEEIQAGHSKLSPTPGNDQTIVTGNGGPSGTGRRPLGETILPPPVFIQDIGPSQKPLSKPINWREGATYEVVDTAYLPSSSPPTPPPMLASEILPMMQPLPVSAVSSVAFQEDKPVLVRSYSTESETLFFVRSEAEADKEKALATARPVKEIVLPDSELVQSLRHKYNDDRSDALRRRSMAAAFNGLSNCAVFPVPVSSLAVSIWNDILNTSSPDLCVNPFGLLNVPVSELLELTLPPVDAAGVLNWPKPLAHYSRGEGRHPFRPLTYRNDTRSVTSSPSKIEAFQQVFPSVKVHSR